MSRKTRGAGKYGPLGRQLNLIWATIFGLISGFCYLLSFPSRFGSHWAFGWVSIFLIIGVFYRMRPRPALWFALVQILTFNLCQLYWISISMQWIVPWLALVVIVSANTFLWAAISIWARGRLAAFPWLVFSALTYAGFESWRGHFPWTGMPWGFLAYAQVDSPLKGWAPFLGKTALSAGCFFLIGLLAIGIGPRRRLSQRVGLLLSLVIIGASAAGYPNWTSSNNSAQGHPEPTLKLATIQGNSLFPISKSLETPNQLLRNHIEQTDKTDLSGVQVVLWPEQAADQDPETNLEARRLLQQLTNRLDAPLLFGTTSVEETAGYNRYLAADDSPDYQVIYTKRSPVPFGEYLPFRSWLTKWFPQLNQLLPVDMLPGTEVGIYQVNTADTSVKLGINICFEVALEDLVQQSVEAGGQVLVFPTSNASFGYSAQSAQQLQIMQFRALEFHRPAVQSALTGISAVVDENGQVLKRTDLFTARSIVAEVSAQSDLTWAARYAHKIDFAFRWGSLALLAMLMLSRLWVSRHSK